MIALMPSGLQFTPPGALSAIMTTPKGFLRWCLVVFCVALVSGCTTVMQVSDKKYPPTDPAKVEVLYEQPQRPHEVIALIDYSGGKGITGADQKWMIQHCKEEAAKIGADAVVIDQLALSGIQRRSRASAKAIKWK